MELVSSLSDSFTIISDTTGYSKPGWTAIVGYRRVWIAEDPWLMFRADEIFYTPSVEGVYREPAIHPVNASAARYIVLAGRASSDYGQTLMSFLKSTVYPWMVISQPKTTYEVRIL